MLSLLVIGLFGLLAVWWQASSTQRTAVVALARDVEVGVPLTAADLTEIQINADIAPRTEAAIHIDLFVDAVPIASFDAGTLLTDQMVRSAAPLREGEALVGLEVDTVSAPSGIATGDRVQVLAGDGSGGIEEAVILADTAVVETVRSSGSQTVVRLRMLAEPAQRVQVNASKVALIELPADDTSAPGSS